MDKFYGLLNKISAEWHIERGENETELNWKCRIVYSILGRMACASMNDVIEDEYRLSYDDEPVSIRHLKKRIIDILESYSDMYPEISSILNCSDNIQNEIYEILCKTGYIYHKPHNISPAKLTTACFSNIEFVRGSATSQQNFVSGIGTYRYTRTNETHILSIAEMFQLEPLSLVEKWNNWTARAQWSNFDQERSFEYLRMKPPFTNGYWNEMPDTSGRISLCRLIGQDKNIYYLYKYVDKSINVFPLPAWLVEDGYRSLSNSCLAAYDLLPCSEYIVDGGVVKLIINYLYSEPVMALIELYSWPVWGESTTFKKYLSKDVFYAIKGVLEQIGYKFKEI